jgi:hypothetical protein
VLRSPFPQPPGVVRRGRAIRPRNIFGAHITTIGGKPIGMGQRAQIGFPIVRAQRSGSLGGMSNGI